MKILVATPASSEPRSDDFNYALPGEPLTLSTLICSTSERREECGCGRSFSGVESQLSTTYGIVEDVDEAEFAAYFADSPHVEGWAGTALGVDAAREILWADVVEIARLLGDVPAETEVRVDATQTSFSLFLRGDGAVREGRRSTEIEALVDAGLRAVDPGESG